MSARKVAVVALLTVIGGLAGCLSQEESGDALRAPDGATGGIGYGQTYEMDAGLAVTGRWTEPFDAEVPAINLVLLHTGQLLYWSGVEGSAAGGTEIDFITVSPYEGESRVLDLSGADPVILTPEMPFGGAADLFCSGQVILPDGRVLTAGSSRWYEHPNDLFFLEGGPDARIFDPETLRWDPVANMSLGRWYPSLILDQDGQGIAASGIGSLTDFTEHWPSMERYLETEDAWETLPGTDQLLPLYPRISLVPGGPLKGDLFYHTVGTMWGPFGEHPLQAQWSWQHTYDQDAGAWRQLELTNVPARQHAASVMLPLDPARGYAPELVTFGGSLYQAILSTPFTERTDLATDPPTNTMAADLNHARWHLNGVGLPDGTVLAVGGGLFDNVVIHGAPNEPILEAEIYHPDRDEWVEAAAMSVDRMYHSTAILLPDARVLAGGHVPLPLPEHVFGIEQVVETRMEIYEPPYLFRGERPVIADAPAAVGYGDTFTIEATTPSGLDSVLLAHPGATTHSFDGGQRMIHLEVLDHDEDAGTITVQAPPDSIVAPPGHYMVFVNGAHADGAIPSVAAWTHLS